MTDDTTLNAIARAIAYALHTRTNNQAGRAATFTTHHFIRAHASTTGRVSVTIVDSIVPKNAAGHVFIERGGMSRAE